MGLNRRSFLKCLSSGLFIAAAPKIIVDMAQNTWRQPKALWEDSPAYLEWQRGYNARYVGFVEVFYQPHFKGLITGLSV